MNRFALPEHLPMQTSIPHTALRFHAGALSQQWVKVLKSATGEVLAFSPYITPSPVTRALAEKGASCKLYTEISAKTYVSRGSELSCLKALRTAGVQVFHLERLHAKVLFIRENNFVTVGSQNMTKRGTQNLEATVVFSSSKEVAQRTWAELEPWTKVAKLVTPQVVADLEAAVEALKQEYEQWKKKVKATTTDIWDSWQKAEDERKRRETVEARSTFRRRHVPPGSVPKFAREIIRGELEQGDRGWSLSNIEFNIGKTPSYCKWVVNDEEIELKKYRWYHCYHLDTGRWGRARTIERRITFLNHGSTWMKIALGSAPDKHYYSAQFNNSDDDPESNITINVSANGVHGRVPGRYGLTNLTVKSPVPHYGVDDDEFDINEFQPFADAINGNEHGIRDKILAELHKSRARKSSSLSPLFRANVFFEGTSDPIYTGLQLIKDQYILLFASTEERLREEMERGSEMNDKS